jgi:hypothetical protein
MPGDFSRGQESSIFSISVLSRKDWSKLTRHGWGTVSDADNVSALRQAEFSTHNAAGESTHKKSTAFWDVDSKNLLQIVAG